VQVYGSNPFFDSRPENYFSDVFYADTLSWQDKDEAFRQSFINRTIRGRVWKQILDELQHADINYVYGHVDNMSHSSDIPGDSGQFEWDMTVSRDDPTLLGRGNADVVIDARGFDSTWFLDLLEADLRVMICGSDTRSQNDARTIKSYITDPSFQINLDGFPSGLHVPNLGEMQHPASTNLMALGSVADAILGAYRRTAPT